MTDFSCVEMDVVFIRHAESQNNALYEQIREELGHDISEEVLDREESVRRSPDPGITQIGMEQVDMLKSFTEQHIRQTMVNPIINDKQKWHIYTSPMKRCLLTTKALANSGISITVKGNMYESGGCYRHDESGQVRAYPGSTGREIEEQFKGYLCDETIPKDEGWYTKGRKETWKEFEIRSGELVEWLWSLMEQQTHEGIFFVGHGNLISAVINGLIFETPKNALFMHNNCGQTHLKLTRVNGVKRVVVLQTQNKHNYIAPSHLTGHRAIEDHWLQEF